MRLTKIMIFNIFIIAFLVMNTAKAACNKMPDDRPHRQSGGGPRMLEGAVISAMLAHTLDGDLTLRLLPYNSLRSDQFFFFMQLYECEYFDHVVVIQHIATQKCLSHTPALDVELVSCSMPDEIDIWSDPQALAKIFYYQEIDAQPERFSYRPVSNGNDPDVWLGHEGPFAIKLLTEKSYWTLAPWIIW